MDREAALEQVGEGWSGLVNRYYDFLDVIYCAVHCECNVVATTRDITIIKKYPEVQTVEVSRGMLRIVATHDHLVVQDMLDKLAWALERDSAKVCEVCGEKGFRRKTLEGSPNRCQPHYIELLDRLADEGKI